MKTKIIKPSASEINAWLVYAAPDLLKSCKIGLKCLKRENKWPSAIASIESAIAKAEGKLFQGYQSIKRK